MINETGCWSHPLTTNNTKHGNRVVVNEIGVQLISCERVFVKSCRLLAAHYSSGIGCDVYRIRLYCCSQQVICFRSPIVYVMYGLPFNIVFYTHTHTSNSIQHQHRRIYAHDHLPARVRQWMSEWVRAYLVVCVRTAEPNILLLLRQLIRVCFPAVAVSSWVWRFVY